MDTQRPGGDVNTSGQYFWQCLFLASITSPSRRSGVLAYLNRYLPKLGVTDRRPSKSSSDGSNDMPHDMQMAADSVVLPEPGLLIRCFASGLTDEQVLVQRNFLDLLVTHLPLSSPILQSRITVDDLQRLLIAAVGVVARRDMSLNRRLWAWLLGPDPASDRTSFEARNSISENADASTGSGQELSQSEYFRQFGLEPLVGGLLEIIGQKTVVPSEKTRPFRISLSLMDRWEVGGHIVTAVFLPIIRNVQAFEKVASKPHFDEVFRSASAFFDGVESGVIFSELLKLIDWTPESLDRDNGQVMDNLRLAQFILENFNVREEDMVLNHVPLLTLSVLIKMNELSPKNHPKIAHDQLRLVSQGLFKVISSLTGLLTERAFSKKLASEKITKNHPTDDLNMPEVLEKIHGFYKQSTSSLDPHPLPFASKQLAELIISKAYELVISALAGDNDIASIQENVNLLIILLKKLPKSRIPRDRRLYLAICNRVSANHTEQSTATFSAISSIATGVKNLYSIQSPGFYISYEDISDLIPSLVKQIWQYLSPLSPKFHVEAVRCLWHLHSVSWLDHLVEASITSLMVNSSNTSRQLLSEEQVGRYFVLWNHSHHGAYELPSKHAQDSALTQVSYQSSLLERPLFIVLDSLSQAPNEASEVVQRWLQDLPSVHNLFTQADPSVANQTSLSISSDDYKECSYLLETIHNIISVIPHNGWVALLAQASAQGDRHHDVSASEVSGPKTTAQTSFDEVKLQQTSLLVMRQLLLGPGAEEVAESGIDSLLVERLSSALDEGGSVAVQEALIDTLLAALKVRFAQAYLPQPPPRPKHQRASSRERLTSPSILSFTSDKAEKAPPIPTMPQPPQQLLECLLKGISSPNSRGTVEKWTMLLCEVLPLYSGSIFQIILMLVDCFCKEIQIAYANLQLSFKHTKGWPEDRSEHATIALLTGLETCIATAHDRLLVDEANVTAVKSPDQPQGFFGNMVSGVFASDASHGRSTAANNRLTVLLCFQDAVRLCFSIWAWGAVERSTLPQDAESLASFQYTSVRMRNRSRRILEHLFTAEALECLETLVEMWTKTDSNTSSLIFSLLHTLDGSRPKITIPAVFNAIYTRTNPSALDPSRKSTLSSTLTENELAGFLVTYARSLDDDVLDEIWTDCTTFLRDVLSNPFPHRQILPRLVEFAAILGAKLENTSFGEDRRMRKELGVRDLSVDESGLLGRGSLEHDNLPAPHIGPDDMLSILASSMPAFTITLGDSDRITTAVSGISTNVIGPLLRSRLFPNNISHSFMALLQHIAKVPAAAKIWKKDIADAFNDPRFFSSHLELVKGGWMNLLRQWVLADKDRLSELMSRLPPPSTAGIMFGVGASAARLDADRKAQLNLRRITLLILSANNDYFIGELPGLLQKLEDLLGATSSSSPSSTTRAEIFMVLRALALKSSTTALAPFWPLINTELQEAIAAVPLGLQQEVYNPYALLQACKLLDTLLVLAPDDFQLLEWLYVTDTIDAVYPPERWEPMALADEISQSFGTRSAAADGPRESNELGYSVKQPGLTADWIRETAKDELIDRVLRPWFEQLSIHAFESTYSMSSPGLTTSYDDLLADLFNESTMAN
ncbi:unnamed protein product [Aspergillus oryzae]|uniref:Unnamed protein product n=2 Tax=Aspergillus oryzae TaxID=5062 RepID=A0AAN4YB22_ASPOZ|nr:unnamed protein product [Aspergillus oryzae]GMF94612.1 unnamed protein product [Aspergillus oryzae]GMG01046.1 unnamed protein product [Aspergillus oryzae]GMG22713.1 unnamed protein product [Aspergillus oryzae]GMG44769.1 unnamed protein product [Aspergillus oryzae var. brunneus]